jgi:hypothetical protein
MTRILHTAIVCGSILIAGCDLPETTAVIDTRIPPTIIEASITPDDFDMGKVTTAGSTASVPVRGYVNVSDDNGLDDIDVVKYTVYTPDGDIYSSGILRDNGVFPDAASGDGKYTSDIMLTLPKDVIGTYTFQYSAVDKEGYTSNTFNLPLSIIYSLNHAPSIANFIVPDTIYVPSSGLDFIKTVVTVGDAEGLTDISAVSLSIVRPSDSSVVAVYGMFDDGNKYVVPPFGYTSGDSIAGDGKFTLTIPVPSNTLKNIERIFTAFAIDQSNAASNVLSKKAFFK